MSTPRLEPSEFAGGAWSAGSDPFDTALISRLANEMYAEIAGAAGPPALPAPLSGALVPGIPVAPASVAPDSVPAAFGFDDFGFSEFQLGSQLPSSALETPPPVHPILNASHPAVVDTPSRPASGGASGSDAYAFGEPRWKDSLVPVQNPHAARSGNQVAAPKSSSGSHTASGIPGYAAAAPPEFYFLREPDSPSAASGPGGGASNTRGPLGAFDVHSIRDDFPALHQTVNGKPLIWFDNAATTHKPQSVIDAVAHFYAHDYSNVNRAAHALAARATKLYEGAREKVREFLGAGDAKEIVFVRGATEAINLVAQTYGRQNLGPGDEILLTTLEHHANIVPWMQLAEQTGAVIRVAPINDAGEIIIEEFSALLGPRTKIAAITHVSNALGTINSVEQLIALAHAYGVPVLVDGAQSTPHLPINVQMMDADFFVFSGHKIFGPTGIGVLYGKAELLERMPPYQGGGSMIEDVNFSEIVYQGIPQKFEAGTQAIASAVGLAAAIDYLTRVGLPSIAAYEHELLAYATQALRSVRGIRQIGTASAKASVLTFNVNGVGSEEVGRYLDQHGIAVRAGHHCAQPALRRFGVETAVRPSFAFYNTREEIDVLIRALHALPRR